MKTPGFAAALCLLGAGMSLPAYAQYPGRIDPNKGANTPTLRATAVLEYTGDLTKPTASRLIPVAVWDGERYQPGGLYMAQPMPLAVESGTQYVLEDAGVPKGLFNVKAAADVSGSWIAIGGFQNMPTPHVAKLKPSKVPPHVVGGAVDDDKPHFAHRPADSSTGSATASSGSGTGSGTSSSGSASSTASSSTPSDPDRPTLHRRTNSDSTSGDSSAPSGSTSGSGSGSGSASGSSSGSSTTSSNAPSVDPDRPTLHRPTDTSSGSGSSGSGSASADPERPTLHKHGAANPNDNGAPVSATMEVDPDRPRLMRGRPENLEPIDDPDKVITAQGEKLESPTAQLKQVIGVSDVKTRAPHSFVYPWNDAQDATKMQASMEDLAKNILAGNGAKLSTPVAKTAATPKKATTTATNRRTTHKAPAPPLLPDLTDEQFKAYELSFGGGATLVFSAKSTVGDQVKYITLIAQPDFDGNPQVILKQVTSEQALDITPRMQLVDAVDTDADNRAELIFELASKRDHQYAIYRVVDRSATQVFSTGGSQD
jgi:hypothetical protein